MSISMSISMSIKGLWSAAGTRIAQRNNVGVLVSGTSGSRVQPLSNEIDAPSGISNLEYQKNSPSNPAQTPRSSLRNPLNQTFGASLSDPLIFSRLIFSTLIFNTLIFNTLRLGRQPSSLALKAVDHVIPLSGIMRSCPPKESRCTSPCRGSAHRTGTPKTGTSKNSRIVSSTESLD